MLRAVLAELSECVRVPCHHSRSKHNVFLGYFADLDITEVVLVLCFFGEYSKDAPPFDTSEYVRRAVKNVQLSGSVELVNA